ncbi:MAG: RNA polymerase sigma factor [Alphaproteobacteria bacterium GM7ARS4]|nr:RNA polymerase sigma factor [Alphaproteobacteria bacterium GM7ARS4]
MSHCPCSVPQESPPSSPTAQSLQLIAETTKDKTDIARDQTLMGAVARGKKDALDKIIRQYGRPLHAFIHRHVADKESSHDIVQESFLRLLRHAPSWQGIGLIRPWLYRTAYRLAMDDHRRHARLTPWNDEHHDNDSQDAPYPPRQEPHSMERHDDRLFLQRCMEELPPLQSAAIDLVYIQGYSHKQAAQIMGKTDDALMSLAARGRKNLRAIMRKNTAISSTAHTP